MSQRGQFRMSLDTPARKDISEDFPARGAVCCDDCGRPMTACWSKGKTRRYPYYLCDTKACPSYRKSIPRDKVEGDIEAFLQRLQPTEGLFQLARAMFRDAWDMPLAQAGAAITALQEKMTEAEKQIEQLLDRIVEAGNTSVVSAYEKRIARLEREKALHSERIASAGRPKHTFEESFEHALTFLANPWKIWRNGGLEMKRTVLRLVFATPPAYARNEGLRTPEIAMPFKVLEEICGGKCEMARPGGLEPPTF